MGHIDPEYIMAYFVFLGHVVSTIHCQFRITVCADEFEAINPQVQELPFKGTPCLEYSIYQHAQKLLESMAM